MLNKGLQLSVSKSRNTNMCLNLVSLSDAVSSLQYIQKVGYLANVM